MIPITPLTGRTVLMNVDLIEQIEKAPETIIVLAGGRRMVVADVAQDLVDRIHRVHAKVARRATTPASKATQLTIVQPDLPRPTPDIEANFGVRDGTATQGQRKDVPRLG